MLIFYVFLDLIYEPILIPSWLHFGSILAPFWVVFRSLGPAYYKIGENVKTSVSPLRFIHFYKTRDSEMC